MKRARKESKDNSRKDRNEGRDRHDVIGALGTAAPLRTSVEGMWKGDGLQSTSVEEELVRYGGIAGLREELLLLCGKGTARSRYPSLAFERWLMSYVGDGDPCVPSGKGVERAALMEDLRRVGWTEAEAIAKADALANAAQRVLDQLTQFAAQRVVKVTKRQQQGGGWKLTGNAVSFELHPDVHQKLTQLFRGDPEDLDRCMFVLCLRYAAIAGPGFQAATTEPLGESVVELFASPFNCSGRVYGSRFRDTDGIFGSLGDAFTWFPHPQCTEYEANPPFVLHVMERMVDTLVAASAVKTPLHMKLIVPRWQDQPFYTKLRKSFPKATVTLLDNQWLQPPILEKGTNSLVRAIPTPSECWSIRI